MAATLRGLRAAPAVLSRTTRARGARGARTPPGAAVASGPLRWPSPRLGLVRGRLRPQATPRSGACCDRARPPPHTAGSRCWARSRRQRPPGLRGGAHGRGGLSHPVAGGGEDAARRGGLGHPGAGNGAGVDVLAQGTSPVARRTARPVRAALLRARRSAGLDVLARRSRVALRRWRGHGGVPARHPSRGTCEGAGLGQGGWSTTAAAKAERAGAGAAARGGQARPRRPRSVAAQLCEGAHGPSQLAARLRPLAAIPPAPGPLGPPPAPEWPRLLQLGAGCGS